MSRPAALHSGCPSPGCTERASSPRRFPLTHPAAEKPTPQLSPIAARPSTSPFLCCPTDPVSFGRHSQGLQSATARECRPEAARRNSHLPLHSNGAAAEPTASPQLRAQPPRLTWRGKAQSCSTQPLVLCVSPEGCGTAGAFQAGVPAPAPNTLKAWTVTLSP